MRITSITGSSRNKAPFVKEDIAADVAGIYDNGMGVHTMYIGEIINVWKK